MYVKSSGKGFRSDKGAGESGTTIQMSVWRVGELEMRQDMLSFTYTVLHEANLENVSNLSFSVHGS
jgi:hypothetical protein